MSTTRIGVTILALCMIVVGISPYALAVALDEATCEDDGVSKQCMITRYRMVERSLCYDNGFCGNVDAESWVHPEKTWPRNWSDGNPIPLGVWMGPMFESLATVCHDCNVSVGPRDIPGLALASVSTGGRQTAATDTWLPALQYVVELNASEVMNGVSQFYWRSPIKWDSNLYTKHALVIRENATGRIVSSNWYPNPVNSKNYVAMLDGDRLYYRVTAHLASLVEYQVTEYVVTAGSPAIFLNDIEVYLAIQSDVGQDNHVSWRLFPGSASERLVLEEPAWSARFVAGTGSGGIFHAVRTDASNLTHIQFVADRVAQNRSQYPELLRFVMPVKTSYPLNVTIRVTASDDGTLNGGSGVVNIVNATSTIIEDIKIDGVNFTTNGSTRKYSLTVEFTNPQATHGVSSNPFDNVFSLGAYEEFDAGGNQTAFSMRTTRGGSLWYESIEWAPYIELSEVDLNPGSSADPFAPQPQGATPTAPTHQTSARAFLLAAGAVVGWLAVGVGIVLTAPVSVPVAAAVIGGAALLGAAHASILLVADANGETFSATAKNMVSDIWAAGKDLALVAACGGSFVAPGVGAKLALGATCALLGSDVYGGLPALLKFAVEVAERIVEVAKVFWAVATDAIRTLLAFAKVLLTLVEVFLGIAIVSTGIFFAREFLLFVMSVYRPIIVAAKKWTPAANVGFHRMDLLIRCMPAPVWDTVQFRWSKELRGRRVWEQSGGKGA